MNREHLVHILMSFAVSNNTILCDALLRLSWYYVIHAPLAKLIKHRVKCNYIHIIYFFESLQTFPAFYRGQVNCYYLQLEYNQVLF